MILRQLRAETYELPGGEGKHLMLPENLSHYTDERNVQILLSLLKQWELSQVIVSPGTTHGTFVRCAQIDPFFKLYSCVDERSAAYMACGMAAESGKPVIITCTQATASRNYLPALTEAYYRKLPLIAITGAREQSDIGSLMPQVIDRRTVPNDICVESVNIPIVKDETDARYCEIEINKAFAAMYHKNGGGPIHINLESKYSLNFGVKQLPIARKITTYTYEDSLPEIEGVRVGIFVGAHNRWSERLTKAVDAFCKKYNAVVLHDHTSNYKGNYGVLYPLVAGQRKYRSKVADLDLLIHIGNVSGDYYLQMTINPAIVWRVNPDGNLVDLFKRLKAVFALTEECFFEAYNMSDMKAPPSRENLFDLAKNEEEAVEKNIPELSFSNIFCCSKLAPKIPSGSVLHLAILSSLRSMNMFKLDKSITVYSNVGGFGIDGATSTLIGSSLASPQKLHFLVTGDLAFFYDINACGNRHVSKNIRILLVNNGLGAEFKVGFNFLRLFEDDTNPFMAAEGHFGSKSQNLIRHYAEDLGFEYLTANNKKSFTEKLARFVLPMAETLKPMIFEVFTEEKNEHDALEMILDAYIEN